MKVKLGDVATYINGYAFKPEDWGNVGLPIIRIQDLTGNSYEQNKYNGEYPERIELNNGDILISWSASIGVYVWNGGKALLNQHIFKVVFDKMAIDKKYFVYAVEHRLNDLVSKTHGSTMKHIVKKDFDNTVIPYPELVEQQKIANTLDQVNNLISLRSQQLEQFDLLIKSRFVEMFGDPVKNEKGWEITTLINVADIKIGPFGSLLHKEDYVYEKHGLVNPSHIIDSKIVIDKNLTVNDEKYNELKPYHLKIGDIVLGRRGEMGRCAVVEENGLLCGTGSIIIRPNNKMKSYFLQKTLSNPVYKKILEKEAVGTTMPNLNVPIVSNLRIPLFPLALQNQFADFVQQVDKAKSSIKKSLEQLETLKKKLMQDYFG